MTTSLPTLPGIQNAPQATGRAWSPYQQAVFDAFITGTGNVIIDAVAGSGKSTTLVEGLKRWMPANPRKTAIFVAFNKSIAEELGRKVPAGVDAKTLHSVCFGALRRRFGHLELDNYKLEDTAKQLISEHREIDREHRAKVAADIKRAYGLLKGTMTDVANVALCNEVLAAYDITLDVPALSVELLGELDARMRANTTRITFDEMIGFVIDHDVTPPTYDLVCVDECQDMNLLQIAILRKMLRPNGRFFAVGDPYQSCYGFRGADSEAMNRIRADFKVPAENELPLSITYRCPRAVVAYAQEFVSHIEAAPNAAEGEVLHRAGTQAAFDATMKAMVPGNMGICRANAPLVSCALALISEGRRACIRGRDIGLSITKLLKDMTKKASEPTVAAVSAETVMYQTKQVEKLRAARKDSQASSIEDRCETLLAILKDADSLDDVDSRIDRLFSDALGEGVVFSSIHKAKGLEASTVVWIGPEITGWILNKVKTEAGRQQEKNLQYIAITRAIKTLIVQPLPAKEGEEE